MQKCNETNGGTDRQTDRQTECNAKAASCENGCTLVIESPIFLRLMRNVCRLVAFFVFIIFMLPYSWITIKENHLFIFFLTPEERVAKWLCGSFVFNLTHVLKDKRHLLDVQLYRRFRQCFCLSRLQLYSLHNHGWGYYRLKTIFNQQWRRPASKILHLGYHDTIATIVTIAIARPSFDEK